MNGFDPQAPLIGPDGLEYACFADFLIGKEVVCPRNEAIKVRKAFGEGPWRDFAREQYRNFGRSGHPYVAGGAFRLPQGYDLF